jgi:hypothetical protein
MPIVVGTDSSTVDNAALSSPSATAVGFAMVVSRAPMIFPSPFVAVDAVMAGMDSPKVAVGILSSHHLYQLVC